MFQKDPKILENRVELEKKFWNSFAKKYDNFLEKNVARTYEIVLDRLVQDTDKSENLLEIATGTGTIAIKLSDHVSHITAIDLAPEMINVAKEKCDRQSIRNIDFKIGDACNIEFPDNMFDTVIASNVLHLLFKPDLALQEMKRVLKDTGRIIVPTYCHGTNIRSHILSRIMGLFGFRARTRWSKQSFKEFVERNGYKIEKVHDIKDKIPLVYLIAVKQ